MVASESLSHLLQSPLKVACVIGANSGPSLSGASPADGDTLSRVICRFAVKRWQSEAITANFLLISLQYDFERSQLSRCN